MVGKGIERISKGVEKDMKKAYVSDANERIDGFLEAAKEDQRACAVLFDAKLYASSTYHLQQAVEKATKAYLLHTGIISVEEVRRIGHNSLQGHIVLAEWMVGRLQALDQLNVNYTDAMGKIDHLKKLQPKELALLDYDQIHLMIASFDAYVNNESSGIRQMVEKLKDKEFLALAIQQAGLGAVVDEEDMETIIKTISNDNKGVDLFEVASVLPFLYIASAVTYPHEAFTRYPDKSIRPEDYTAELGIVQATPELLGRLERTLVLLEDNFGSSC